MAKLREKQASIKSREAIVVCDCGEVFRAERTNQYEVLECDVCGREVFVLPCSPYPPVEAAEPEPAVPHARPSPRAKSQPSPSEAKAGRPDLSLETRGRLITPLRLTLMLGIVVVALTGYWIHRRRVRSNAERAFVFHNEAGDEALQRNDHVTARREFEQAVEAVEILGRDDADARRARQMFRESTAITDLSQEPLYGILTEAETARGSPEDWKRTFQRDYGGKWLVLDTTIRKDAAGTGVEITYPLEVNGQPVTLSGELDVWKDFSLSDGTVRVILAVQLKSCTRSAAGSWVLELESKSAFLWSNFDNLLAVGFTVAPENRANVPGEIDTASELRQFLQNQSRKMGLEQ